MRKRLAILGSTGSIGTQALDIVRNHPDLFEVVALSANRNTALLQRQMEEFKPSYACVCDQQAARELEPADGLHVLTGPDALQEICALQEVDLILLCVVGISGLRALMHAIQCGKKVALANKESMVCGGTLVQKALARHPKAEIIPVDSEHCAIYQCLCGEQKRDVKRLILTGSGGPFRTWEPERIAQASKEMALKHPVWSMGQKITIDSASMMNKGLEVIEAKFLFDISEQQIDVLIHPQTTIHSMVEFQDGVVMAQMGIADMRVPIQYALHHPKGRLAFSERLNFLSLQPLTFEEVDENKFPCFALCREALRKGGSAPVAINAANEAAVALFLEDRIRFSGITKAVEAALNRFGSIKDPDLEHIFDIDAESRAYTNEMLAK
ncbi:MAG: 1-deoxy-D-xylulose-5-phosphate reductoisomerase [Christensenellales bacterium]